jgi:hypothetical protein
MKVDKVSYQKLFPIGSFVNERIGVEITIDENDDVTQVLNSAKSMVEKFHKDSNPLLYIDSVPETNPIRMKEKRPEGTEEGIIFDIGSVKELKVLETYAFLAKNNQKINEAYQKQKQFLSI